MPVYQVGVEIFHISVNESKCNHKEHIQTTTLQNKKLTAERRTEHFKWIEFTSGGVAENVPVLLKTG